MPSVPVEVIKALQSNVKNIRNICIVAHVDHGTNVEIIRQLFRQNHFCRFSHFIKWNHIKQNGSEDQVS